MIKYVLKQIKNPESKVNNKWFAYPVKEEIIDVEKLADHMAAHNSPYTSGVLKGILTDMVTCIKELILDGKSVKIPDLAIFSVGIKNAPGGAASEEDFTVQENVKSVRLLARSTGSLSSKKLEATLKRATVIVGSKKTEADADESTVSEEV